MEMSYIILLRINEILVLCLVGHSQAERASVLVFSATLHINAPLPPHTHPVILLLSADSVIVSLFLVGVLARKGTVFIIIQQVEFSPVIIIQQISVEGLQFAKHNTSSWSTSVDLT